MSYDVDYFINKFQEIPEDNWTTYELENYEGCHCALGHLGVKAVDGDWIPTAEAGALIRLFGGKYDDDWDFVYRINDIGAHPITGIRKYNTTKSPKQRILLALNDVKNGTY